MIAYMPPDSARSLTPGQLEQPTVVPTQERGTLSDLATYVAPMAYAAFAAYAATASAW